MDNSAMRDTIIQTLRKEKGFESMTIAEISGNNFAAADIAVQDKCGKSEIYRIAVIRHNVNPIER